MASHEILRQLLAQQRLTQNPFQSPQEVVAWLGAVQAQDYPGAKWALGLRMHGATEGMVEKAFNSGEILRTHAMRPTWHFVAPEDIRWLLELTAPRVNAVNAHMYRRLELDDALFRRSNNVIAGALQGGPARTRKELGAVLAEAGIFADGPRLGYILHRAELDALVCSGPRRGAQFTYALLEERAPNARSLPREEALAELTRRYYTGHGPATARDFSWWSGLTLADARAGLEMAASNLTGEELDGQVYYYSALLPSLTQAARIPEKEGKTEQAFFLPTYDELLIGFSSFNKSRTGGQELRQGIIFDSMIVTGGRIVGSWRRTFKKGIVVIEIAPFAPLTPAQEAAIAAAARRFGGFLGMPVVTEDRAAGEA
jgi:hypothetical protein